MPHYKLTYFPGRGLAEVSRQLFHLAGVQFEDHRLAEHEFDELKPKLPTGQVPILSIDGVEYHQSTAIGRFLARKFGYAGKTPEEEFRADSIVDTFKDFIVSFRQLAEAILFGKPEDADRIRETIVKPAAKIFFKYIAKILEVQNSSGFLVGSSLTWADLVIADSLTSCLNTGLLDKDSGNQEDLKLLEFRKKIMELPELKEYFEKRPVTLL